MLRIYISSSFKDLTDHRKVLFDLILRMGEHPVNMEHYVAESLPTLEMCLRDVRECDIYVGIVAHRYGEIVEGHDKSYTELEYRCAIENEIPRLLFVLDENESVGRQYDDGLADDDAVRERIKAWRRELMGHSPTLFKDEEDLVGLAGPALKRCIEDLRSEEEREEMAVVPIAQVPDELSRYLYPLAYPRDDQGMGIDRFYVPLAGQTDAPRTRFLRRSLKIHQSKDGSEGSKTEVEDMQAALEVHNQFVLIGTPGSGKTTALRQLEMLAARRALSDPLAPIPLYVNLAKWPRGIHQFEELLQTERVGVGMPGLPSSSRLILLDGLNEIDADFYEERLSQLESWLRENQSTQVVLSTRKRHYLKDDNLRLSIPTVELFPFDDDRIRQFVENYFQQDEEQAKGLLRLLWGEGSSGQTSRRLWSLARNPYQLLIFCELYSLSAEGLPESRATLFEALFEALHEREVERSNHRGIGFSTMKEEFGRLSVDMFRAKEATVVHVDFAKKRLSNPDDLLYLGTQTSLISLSREDTFLSFNHQSLQDALAADYLSAHEELWSQLLEDATYVSGTSEVRKNDIDEVFFILAERPSIDGKKLCDVVSEYDPLLAVDIYQHFLEHHEDETDWAFEDDVSKVHSLLEQLSVADESRTAEIASRFKALGRRAFVELDYWIDEAHPKAKRSLIPFLRALGNVDGLTRLIRMLRDRKHVRQDAEDEIIEIVEQSPERLSDYIANVLANEPPMERRVIAENLLSLLAQEVDEGVSLFQIDASQLRELQRSIVDVTGGSIRISWLVESRFPADSDLQNAPKPAAYALDDPKILIDWLDKYSPNAARHHIDRLVDLGEVAVPQMLQALDSGTSRVVRRVCRALGLMAADAAVPALIKLCENSTESSVKLNAARALGKIGDPVSLPVLRRLLQDDDSPVRVIAIRAIRKIGVQNGFNSDDVDQFKSLVHDFEAEIRIHALAAWHIARPEEVANYDRRDECLAEAIGIAEDATRSLRAASAADVVMQFDPEAAKRIALKHAFAREKVLREEFLEILGELAVFRIPSFVANEPVQRAVQIREMFDRHDLEVLPELTYFAFDVNERVRLELLCCIAEAEHVDVSEFAEILHVIRKYDRAAGLRDLAGMLQDDRQQVNAFLTETV